MTMELTCTCGQLLTGEPAEVWATLTRHLAEGDSGSPLNHNASPAQWTDAYNIIQASKEKKRPV